MASAEHLKQLQEADNESSTDTASEPTSEPEQPKPPSPKPPPPPSESSASKPPASSSLSTKHPKMRIKLSLKLPTKENKEETTKDDADDKKKPSLPKKKFIRKLKLPLSRPQKTTVDDENVAQVVDSDDDEAGEEDDAVAIMAPVSIHGTTATSATQKSSSSSAPKRRATVAKGIRIPPLSSPGLLIPSSTSSTSSMTTKATATTPDANGLVTPAAIFDAAMKQQGYTLEARTQRPHRGSSVRRVVGDMFDTNVKLSLQFSSTNLVPRDLLDEKDENAMDDSLPDLLVHSLHKALQKSNSKKRKRPYLQFSDLVPVSLTIPYPESYLQRRLDYVRKVKEREKAIIVAQEAELALLEDNDETNGSNNNNKASTLPTVPPIPQPPSPPTISELDNDMEEKYDDRHPLYLPKNKQDLVAHLDKQCFHLTKGRYFGLQSNFWADPNFCGPNAPGLAGIHGTGGAGLATSTAGSGSTTATAGSAMILGTGFHSAATNTVLTTTTTTPKNSNNNAVSSNEKNLLKKTTTTTKVETESKDDNDNDNDEEDEDDNDDSGLKATALASDLRKIMEQGGVAAESMRDCIIRAAVHGNRSGRHGQPFVGPNGEECYPDVSKAFAAHAGIKPCVRCKNNKQGAYHCRLRRRHKDLDYDGGDSPSLLAPLFDAPMDSLLVKRP